MHKTDQKKRSQGTARDGKTNQLRGRTSRSVGSRKPGGDGPGTARVKREHDDTVTRKQPAQRLRPNERSRSVSRSTR